jgi:allene oxide cyclase
VQAHRAIGRPAALAVGLAAMAAAGAGATSGGSAQTPRTFDVVERTTAVQFVDAAPAGDSLGDTVIAASDLFGASNRRIGTAHWTCVRTNVGRLRQCTLSYFFARGMLALQGPYRDDGTGTFAITGGTGRYRTAHGWVDLLSTTTPDEGRTFVYRERFHVLR